MSSQFRFSRGIFVATLSLFAAAPIAASAADAPKPANSGKGRYSKQETEVKATQTNLTKPQAPPPPKKQTGPTLTVDQFREQKTQEIQKIVDAQISKMRRLIDGHGGRRSAEAGLLLPPRRALRREAALQLQQRRARSIRRSSSCSPTSAARCWRSRRTTKQQEQKWLLEAVKAFIGATKFRKYERMDEVLFRLAFLLTSVKKEDQAREFFHRLIKDYPNSKYIPDAYLSFAEYYFDKGEMENALKFYEKVEQFPKSSVYPYAVYKKGWCYINLGDFKTALETFVGVVRMTQEGKVNVPKKQLEVLAKEAKKDIVKAYSHVGGPDKAWEFFQKTRRRLRARR